MFYGDMFILRLPFTEVLGDLKQSFDIYTSSTTDRHN